MADEERIARIRAAAGEHDGRYLLPHRFVKDRLDLTKSDVDLDYDACEALVNRGEARWLSAGYGGGGPGIQIVQPLRPEPPPRPPMPLEEALSRLAAVHTKDDEKVGWHVVMGATPDAYMMEQGEYVRAWETVRRHLGLQVDPKD